MSLKRVIHTNQVMRSKIGSKFLLKNKSTEW